MARLLQPSAITLDILLADAKGWDVLRELKAEPDTRDIPVVVVSVVDDPETAQQAGAVASLVKPVDPEVLVKTVSRYARNGHGK